MNLLLFYSESNQLSSRFKKHINMPEFIAVSDLLNRNHPNNTSSHLSHVTGINYNANEVGSGVKSYNNTFSTVDIEPNDSDVLSRRGKHVFNHPGNIRLMSLVKQYQSKINDCPKYLKPKIAKKIMIASAQRITIICWIRQGSF